MGLLLDLEAFLLNEVRSQNDFTVALEQERSHGVVLTIAEERQFRVLLGGGDIPQQLTGFLPHDQREPLGYLFSIIIEEALIRPLTLE